MSISLFDVALPSQNCSAGQTLLNKIKLPQKGNMKWATNHYRQNYNLANFLLEICKETAEAILNGHYNQFDALVKNFGCQMTAIEVHQLVKQPEIKKEALRVQQIATNQLALLASKKNGMPEGLHGMSFADYMQNCCGIEAKLSPEMAQLLRFRILNIVNSNVLDTSGRERPQTDVSALQGRLEALQMGTEERKFLDKNFSLKTWVERLQEEESRHAAEYIRQAANQITDPERGPILQRMLSSEFARQAKAHTKVLSVPQMHCGEAAVRGIDEGYLLVKNKTHNCHVIRANAQPIKIVVKMPEEQILSVEEVALLPPETPVMVFDTLMTSECDIVDIINTIGVVRLLNATLSQLPQYVRNIAPDIQRDEEIKADIAQYQGLYHVYKQAEVEHMYTSSLQDEL